MTAFDLGADTHHTQPVAQTPSPAAEQSTGEQQGVNPGVFLPWSRWERAARAIAERLWQRDQLAFLAICAGARERGTTLLARVRERLAELREAR